MTATAIPNPQAGPVSLPVYAPAPAARADNDTYRRDRVLYPPRSHYRCLIQRRLSAAMDHAASQLEPGDRLIDLGCGDMKYKPLFLPRVGRYLGADLPGSPHAELTINAAGRVDQPDGSADAVLSTQVLEHVPRPANYLAEAWRLLRPGGTLILTTHGMWQYHPHPRDLWRWTGEGLCQTLADAGFGDTTITGLMGLAATGVHLAQDGLYRRLPRPFRRPLFWCCQSLAIALDRDDPDNACVYLTISRKGERP